MAIAAMIRMIATTISNSMSENPFCFFITVLLGQQRGIRDKFLSALLKLGALYSPPLVWAKKEHGFLCRALLDQVSLQGQALLQRRQARCSASCVHRTGSIAANYTRFIRAEAVLSRLSDRNRNGRGVEIGVGASCRGRATSAYGHEVVSALGPAAQVAIDQASGSRTGSGATCSRRAQVGQRCSIARSISTGISDLCSVDGAQRTDCGSFVGRHFGAQQVRNGDGRDDQNERHNDEQLDKRETLLLLHDCCISLRDD